MSLFTSKLGMRIILSLAVIALIIVCAVVNYRFQRDALDLVEAGTQASGVIKNKNCSNAGLVYYSFSVEGKEFSGASNACVASCPNSLIGESVTVTYSTKNPENSICGSAEQVAGRFTGNYFGLLMVGIGLLVVIYRTTQRK